MPAGLQEGQELCEYKIEVHTGDVRGAGTDSNVAVSIWYPTVDLHIEAGMRETTLL